MITCMNRFQVTHATAMVLGTGWFVVFDVTGEMDSHIVHGYDNAVAVRDGLRAAQARQEFRVVNVA